MKNSVIILILIVVLLPRFVFAGLALKNEPYDSFENLMNLNPFFTQEVNPNIFESQNGAFSARVISNPIIGARNYYGWSVTSGSTFWIDVDGAAGVDSGSFDALLAIWNAETGELLTVWDDRIIDPGSNSSMDPWFEWTFDYTGSVIAAVGKFPTMFSHNGVINGNTFNGTETYEFIVSGDFISVPCPSSFFVFSFGILGCVCRRKLTV